MAPHFAASTTLRFQLVVTDMPYAAASAPAFTTVQINANRGTGCRHAVRHAGARARGTTVTITVPASANDADGDPVAGFTYQWVQTDSARRRRARRRARSPTSRSRRSRARRAARRSWRRRSPWPSATLFFRLTVNDGFGASVQSTNLTVALTNTAPTVPARRSLKTGYRPLGRPTRRRSTSARRSTIDADRRPTPTAPAPLTYVVVGSALWRLGDPRAASSPATRVATRAVRAVASPSRRTRSSRARRRSPHRRSVPNNPTVVWPPPRRHRRGGRQHDARTGRTG